MVKPGVKSSWNTLLGHCSIAQLSATANLHNIVKLVGFDTGLGAEGYPFTGGDGIDEGEHIIDQLCYTTTTHIADVEDIGANVLENRFTGLKGLLIADHYNCQRTMLSPRNAATNRCIEHDDAFFC